MEKPKILGITNTPTEEDLYSGRMHENGSPLRALRYLVENPEKTKQIADLITYPPLSQKLHEISSLKEKTDEEYEDTLIEALDTRYECEELEEKMIERVKERFTEDFCNYLDKLSILYNKEDLTRRTDQVMINFLDYVRYFGNAIYLDVDIEEACSMAGYYIADSDSISINLSGIDGIVASSAVEIDKEEAFRAELINATLRHELVHALSYQNFWVTENPEDQKDQTDSRRLGIRGLSIDRESKSLVHLNEAITEKLNQETLSNFLPEKDIRIKDIAISYEKEVEILDVLCESIDWSFFVSACFSKHGLLSLGKELKRKTGLTLTELDDAMKIDYKDGYKNNHTINLLRARVVNFIEQSVI